MLCVRIVIGSALGSESKQQRRLDVIPRFRVDKRRTKIRACRLVEDALIATISLLQDCRCAAVAQLVERFLGKDEVLGSNPSSSSDETGRPAPVGAEAPPPSGPG